MLTRGAGGSIVYPVEKNQTGRMYIVSHLLMELRTHLRHLESEVREQEPLPLRHLVAADLSQALWHVRRAHEHVLAAVETQGWRRKHAVDE